MSNMQLPPGAAPQGGGQMSDQELMQMIQAMQGPGPNPRDALAKLLAGGGGGGGPASVAAAGGVPQGGGQMSDQELQMLMALGGGR